ncbi:MAG: hypothetical protein ACTJLM_04955 [Ehrlichia sp.]
MEYQGEIPFYSVIGDDYNSNNGVFGLSGVISKDLEKGNDICKYILAIACYNDGNSDYVKTNNFIKDLLILTGHGALTRKANYLIICRDFDKYGPLYSEIRKKKVEDFYKDMKMDYVLKELSIDHDKKIY